MLTYPTGFYTPPSSGGGGGGFDPDSVSGLEGWWKPEALTDQGLSDGDPISSWPDSSSSGGGDASQGTAAEQFTYRANVLNGYAVAEVNDEHMETTLSITTPYTLFLLFKRTGGGGWQRPLAGSGNRWIGDQGSGSVSMYPASDTGYSDDTWHLVSGIRRTTSPTTQLFYQGSLVDTDDGDTTDLGTVTLGGSGTTDELTGFMVEALAYNRELTSQEHTDVVDYLMNKYAL